MLKKEKQKLVADEVK